MNRARRLPCLALVQIGHFFSQKSGSPMNHPQLDGFPNTGGTMSAENGSP
jgi:hypothetical protein